MYDDRLVLIFDREPWEAKYQKIKASNASYPAGETILLQSAAPRSRTMARQYNKTLKKAEANTEFVSSGRVLSFHCT